MRKVASSALGLLLLNPIGCSGTPTEVSGTGGSTAASTGGYTGVVHCDPSVANVCGPGRICKQTMFPIMPPGGFGGSVSSDMSFLYECVPAGTGGSSGTGGSHSTGGAVNTAGTKSLGTKAELSTPRRAPDLDEGSWWKIAEAALRKA